MEMNCEKSNQNFGETSRQYPTVEQFGRCTVSIVLTKATHYNVFLRLELLSELNHCKKYCYERQVIGCICRYLYNNTKTDEEKVMKGERLSQIS